MSNVDKRGKLQEEVFSYTANKDGKVFIFWQGQQIMILKDSKAKSFLTKIANLEGPKAQLVMAKITGNFKHGNEKNH